MTDSKRVLVVDDDRAIREALAEALDLEGYEVLTAPDGAQALEKVQHQRPHVVLLDLMMPIMDGWAFLRACREDQRCAETPVVVMSAYSGLAEEVSKLGASACIAKPFELDVLLGSVERLANRQCQ